MTKHTEVMKLAQELRALADRFSEGWYEGIKIDASDIVLLSDAAEALALVNEVDQEQPAQRKPLTDEEIERCMKQAYATVQGRNLERAFARAIEAAHGIKGDA